MTLAKTLAEIETTARPQPAALLLARAIVQQDANIQKIFLQAKADQWSAERLGIELEDPLQSQMTEDVQEVVQVARYLADEFLVLGETTLLIDRATGKAIRQLAEDDLWQPPMVPREGGGMVLPPKRLRPELEAAIIFQAHERDREKKLIEEIAPTLRPTDLLREQGDPRLAPLTHGGRVNMVDQLRTRLPTLLPMMASGGPGQFLSHFEFRHTDPEGSSFEPLLRCTAVARGAMGIQDAKAMNLRFDGLGHLCMITANTWVREVGAGLATAAKEHFNPSPRAAASLVPGDVEGVRMWVIPPDVVSVLWDALRGGASVLPVESSISLGLLGKAGAIVADPNTYECAGRELFGRWEVVAKMDYVLWVDWAEVRAFHFTDVPSTFAGVIVPQ